ncbi:polysaccharide pyruvyl transferase family protein [Streptomyces ureilyticus]|uniref:Polysaccharide pyruvyl transferase family protein n=1 Tax=Streptomyces ureilyticus TaxID=1775131 RepID=A0ABX0DR53_9ACTN|nr:polysaccharide pyruvyl transferase family protein [Streptomyces ureilyticus]NGO43205.1 polysaccharide pyruvyl transferase family protein [Streptomyces ureilyticus]
MTGQRILLTGWFSFLDGEATAGDVLALRRVEQALDRAGLPYDTVWSPGFHPEALHFADVRPDAYSHLVFVCGPLAGSQVAWLHEEFRACRRIAVGVSVVDPEDPAATGFHLVLPRDAPGAVPALDLSASAPIGRPTPVVGVILTHGQQEYGPRRRHAEVAEAVTRWLSGKDCAPVELETRLDTRDWRLDSTPEQFQSVLARLDCVVTDRLHGLVLALRTGIPVLAVDPVAGGAKLTAQARACDWPALVPAERLDARQLDRWWDWCLTSGRAAARQSRDELLHGPSRSSLQGLVDALAARPLRSGRSSR